MRGSGYSFEWANTFALAVAVVAITPLAKGSVYVTGFVVEMLLLGPDPGTTYADIGLVAGLDVFIRLFVVMNPRGRLHRRQLRHHPSRAFT